MFRRVFCAAVFGCLVTTAAPPLTTIQDVLYKADGSRFNGTLTISWNSFQSVDNSDIVSQSTTVKVVDGNLRVQLVPTTTSTPPATYRVKYNSDGRIAFEETWSVPSSTQPLHVRDVRLAATGSSAADTVASGSGPIPESSVVGLLADLGARPLKGPQFAAGSVALVDPTGMLAAVTGDPSDCVRVDGSAGPCGDVSPTFVDTGSLAGIVDGANTSFGLSAVPNPASSLEVYRNGVLQMAGQDYNLTGSTVQFVAAATPQPGDTLLASFRAAATGSSGTAVFTAPQVLCSGAGGTTNSAAPANVGSCQIPAGLLLPGDRVQIRFEVAHQGSAGGFSIEVDWGATTVMHRDGAIGDALVTGSAEVGISSTGGQWSTTSWGTLLPFAPALGTASDNASNGLTIAFVATAGQAADQVTLSNYAVIRIP